MKSLNPLPQKEEYRLYIKNMVCNRCIMVVEELFRRLCIETVFVTLGIVRLKEPLTAEQKEKVEEHLRILGFELIMDKRFRIVEQIKTVIMELVHRQDNDLKVNLSDYLTEKTGLDYSSLSKLFSEIHHLTIEKYFIAQKIERVKELLVYDELSLNEIADRLNYSSAAHLSSQFKSVVEMTPTQFKKLRENNRKPLDLI
ncbi:MAG: AraC family transcriptional regulator [Tannerellaceae bacterium]|nr:AraC family transcriptional regulator [Tannerellaceae bacterium]